MEEAEESTVVEFARSHDLHVLRLGLSGDPHTEKALDELLEALVGLVPALPKPEQLIRKNVCVGKKLLLSTKYQMVLSKGSVRPGLALRLTPHLKIWYTFFWSTP